MTAKRYAAATKVPVERSKAELDELLKKHGAAQRAVFVDEESGRHAMQFTLGGRMIRTVFVVDKKNEQKARQAWRRMILITKAKLELVADGASTIEREFLADVMLPDGKTVGELLAKQLVQTYKDGKMPPLLGPGP